MQGYREYTEYRDKQEMLKRIAELETRLSALTRYLGVEYKNNSEYMKEEK